MAKFIAIVTQKGDGCDHTIGCGWNYESIEAESMDDAWANFVKRWADYDATQGGECDPRKGGPGGDWSPIDHVLLIRVAEEDAGRFTPWFDGIVAAFEAKEVADDEAKERAELERLQKKFNK